MPKKQRKGGSGGVGIATRKIQNTNGEEKKKVEEEEHDDALPRFTAFRRGPIVIFYFDSSKAQHQALARIEAFYESSQDEKTYMTLEEARGKRICANYQAFNLPISSLKEWLQCMREGGRLKEANKEESRTKADGILQEANVFPWWTSYTNVEEAHLLKYLCQLGCLDEGEEEVDQKVTYLISSLRSSSSSSSSSSSFSSISHESLHALYFLNPQYRTVAQQAWSCLSRKTQSVIQHDLQLRGYAQHVWIDEFQAYVSENELEFGNKTKEDCQTAKGTLRGAQKSCWQDIGLTSTSFSSL